MKLIVVLTFQNQSQDGIDIPFLKKTAKPLGPVFQSGVRSDVSLNLSSTKPENKTKLRKVGRG